MSQELQVLSTMLARQDFGPIVRGEITESHLSTTDAATIYNFITQYKHTTDGAARYPTLETVRERYRNTGIEVPDPAHPSASLAGLVHEVRIEKLRRDLAVASTLLDQLSSSNDPFGGIGPVLKDLRKASEEIQRARHLSLKDAVQDIIADYDAGVLLTEGLPWPWPSMQVATKGLQRKEFTVIAGRPKSRKTFVALCICAYIYMCHNARVLFVSPEMPAKQIMLRMIAFVASVRYTEFKNAQLNEAELNRLLNIADQYGRVSKETEDDYSFRLNDALALDEGCLPPSFDVVQGTNKSVSWIQSQIEIFQPDLVVVDSFYRLKNEGGKARDADWKQVTGISRALKDLAMEANVAIVGTHQMNRDSEGKVGTTGNLALADAVGQDADLILRVITGSLDGVDHSALMVLGGREVPFDGVLIRNRPCFDYDEVKAITNKKEIMRLLSEDEEDEDEEDGKKRGRRKGKAKFKAPTLSERHGERIRKAAEEAQTLGSEFSSQQEDDAGDS